MANRANTTGKTINSLTEQQKAYLAGLFDGEGTLGIIERVKNGNRFYYIRAKIAMTHFPVIEYYKEVTGLGFWTVPAIIISKQSGKINKPQLMLTFESRQAEQLIRTILPYMRVKNKEVEVALEFQDTVVGSIYDTTDRVKTEAHWSVCRAYREKLKALKKAFIWPTNPDNIAKLEKRFRDKNLDLQAYRNQYFDQDGKFIWENTPQYAKNEEWKSNGHNTPNQPLELDSDVDLDSIEIVNDESDDIEQDDD